MEALMERRRVSCVHKLGVWVGCTTRRFFKQTIDKIYSLLGQLGIRVSVMDTKEICCGSVLVNTGMRLQAAQNAKLLKSFLAARLKRLGVEGFVALCPGCARTFRDYYGVDGVEHIVTFLADHISEFSFSEPSEKPCTVTYHDPCHLGRHLGVYDAPRKILAVLPHVKLVEMPHVRERAFCCGFGGGVRAYDEEFAECAARLRLREAQSTAAELLLTACPFCELSFRSALGGVGTCMGGCGRSTGAKAGKVQEVRANSLCVMNIVDLVARAAVGWDPRHNIYI